MYLALLILPFFNSKKYNFKLYIYINLNLPIVIVISFDLTSIEI